MLNASGLVLQNAQHGKWSGTNQPAPFLDELIVVKAEPRGLHSDTV
jgi:hypothetical protein